MENGLGYSICPARPAFTASKYVTDATQARQRYTSATAFYTSQPRTIQNPSLGDATALGIVSSRIPRPSGTRQNTTEHNTVPTTGPKARRHHTNTSFNSLHHHGTSLYHICNKTSTSSKPTKQDTSHSATLTAGSQSSTALPPDALATRRVAGVV